MLKVDLNPTLVCWSPSQCSSFVQGWTKWTCNEKVLQFWILSEYRKWPGRGLGCSEHAFAELLNRSAPRFLVCLIMCREGNQTRPDPKSNHKHPFYSESDSADVKRPLNKPDNNSPNGNTSELYLINQATHGFIINWSGVFIVSVWIQ